MDSIQLLWLVLSLLSCFVVAVIERDRAHDALTMLMMRWVNFDVVSSVDRQRP